MARKKDRFNFNILVMEDRVIKVRTYEVRVDLACDCLDPADIEAKGNEIKKTIIKKYQDVLFMREDDTLLPTMTKLEDGKIIEIVLIEDIYNLHHELMEDIDMQINTLLEGNKVRKTGFGLYKKYLNLLICI